MVGNTVALEDPNSCPRCGHSVYARDWYCPSCGKQLDYSQYERKDPQAP